MPESPRLVSRGSGPVFGDDGSRTNGRMYPTDPGRMLKNTFLLGSTDGFAIVSMVPQLQ
jgi:hypothetical protein